MENIIILLLNIYFWMFNICTIVISILIFLGNITFYKQCISFFSNIEEANRFKEFFTFVIFLIIFYIISIQYIYNG